MYRVVQFFTDLQDKGYAYRVGDTFPREGLTPSTARINELLNGTNRRHLKLIEEVEEKASKVDETDVEEVDETPIEEAEEIEKPKEKKSAKAKTKTKEG
jgi:hypothetical protein